jgi:hypothetical protein
MITGLNSSIEYLGVEYHVQTEDKEPLFETLVYRGGAILKKITFDYKKGSRDSLSQDDIKKLLDKQHKETIIALRRGELFRNTEHQTASDSFNIKDNPTTLDEMLFNHILKRRE